MGQDMGGELRALLETGQSWPQNGRLQPHGTRSITEVFDSFKGAHQSLCSCTGTQKGLIGLGLGYGCE